MSQHHLGPSVPHCESCGDVIGVYEPAVVVVGGFARDTSLAAEPTARADTGVWHHRACFEERVEAVA